MLSETERVSLSDILFNIDLTNSFAQGFDYQRFLGDMRTFYAITRRLEIISEASRRLSPEMKARCPGIPWRKVPGSGNIYRHDYEDVAHLNERGSKMLTLRALRQASDAGAAREIIANARPPLFAGKLPSEPLKDVWKELRRMPEPASRPELTRDDWFGAIAVFLLAFLSTPPVVVPFVFIGDARSALRVSYVVAITMMFVCSYAFGR